MSPTGRKGLISPSQAGQQQLGCGLRAEGEGVSSISAPSPLSPRTTPPAPDMSPTVLQPRLPWRTSCPQQNQSPEHLINHRHSQQKLSQKMQGEQSIEWSWVITLNSIHLLYVLLYNPHLFADSFSCYPKPWILTINDTKIDLKIVKPTISAMSLVENNICLR